ncbi:MAG TPA: hypothetical protein VIL74_04460 [Pyrinomonadaceae bacterium]|jgi:hypothetical protein
MTPLSLAPLSKDYAFGEVLKWAANPVLILFFGGFAFGFRGVIGCCWSS